MPLLLPLRRQRRTPQRDLHGRKLLDLDILVLEGLVALHVGLCPRRPEAERRRLPHVAAQDEARVEDGQDTHGDHDHGALEDHEEDLVVGQLAVEAVLQLGEPEGGTDQDGEDGEADGFFWWVLVLERNAGGLFRVGCVIWIWIWIWGKLTDQ